MVNYCVVAEPGDVSFISGVEQNRSIWLVPVFVSHKVSLLKGAVLKESKVINLNSKNMSITLIKGY